MTLLAQYRDLLDERLRPQPIDVPGFERGALAVRLLTDGQAREVSTDAWVHLEQQAKDAGVSLVALLEVDPDMLDRERMVQVIARAFIDANDIDNEEAIGFLRPEMVRDLDSVMVSEIFNRYLAYQDAKGIPIPTPKQADELLAALRSPNAAAEIATLDEPQLRSLIASIIPKVT